MDFKFNINYEVKVKLTETGIDVLKKRRAELNQSIQAGGGEGLGEYELKTDEQGYTKFAMWDLMNLFGHLMSFGFKLPFETDVIITQGRRLIN